MLRGGSRAPEAQAGFPGRQSPVHTVTRGGQEAMPSLTLRREDNQKPHFLSQTLPSAAGPLFLFTVMTL